MVRRHDHNYHIAWKHSSKTTLANLLYHVLKSICLLFGNQKCSICSQRIRCNKGTLLSLHWNLNQNVGSQFVSLILMTG